MLRGHFVEVAPRRKGEGKKFGYNMMHGSNPMVVIKAPNEIEQKAEKAFFLLC